MPDHIENAVVSALSADATEFKNNILAALSQKIEDALEFRKTEIAQSFFGSKQEQNTDDNSENEEENNEEF